MPLLQIPHTRSNFVLHALVGIYHARVQHVNVAQRESKVQASQAINSFYFLCLSSVLLKKQINAYCMSKFATIIESPFEERRS